MTLLVYGFEGGTNGTNLSTTGAGSGDTNFDTVHAGTSSTGIYDTTHAAHGSQAGEFGNGAASSNYGTWNSALTGTSIGTVWFRLYCYFTANPSATVRIFNALNASSGLCAGINVLTSGLLRTVNTASATIRTASSGIPLNAWFRIEGFIIGDPSVGQVELKLWSTPDSPDTPDWTLTSTAAQNTSGGIASARYGMVTNQTGLGNFWLDDVGASDTAYIGPVAGGGTVTPTAAITGTGTAGTVPIISVGAALAGSGSIRITTPILLDEAAASILDEAGFPLTDESGPVTGYEIPALMGLGAAGAQPIVAVTGVLAGHGAASVSRNVTAFAAAPGVGVAGAVPTILPSGTVAGQGAVSLAPRIMLTGRAAGAGSINLTVPRVTVRAGLAGAGVLTIVHGAAVDISAGAANVAYGRVQPVIVTQMDGKTVAGTQQDGKAVAGSALTVQVANVVLNRGN